MLNPCNCLFFIAMLCTKYSGSLYSSNCYRQSVRLEVALFCPELHFYRTFCVEVHNLGLLVFAYRENMIIWVWYFVYISFVIVRLFVKAHLWNLDDRGVSLWRFGEVQAQKIFLACWMNSWVIDVVQGGVIEVDLRDFF